MPKNNAQPNASATAVNRVGAERRPNDNAISTKSCPPLHMISIKCISQLGPCCRHSSCRSTFSRSVPRARPWRVSSMDAYFKEALMLFLTLCIGWYERSTIICHLPVSLPFGTSQIGLQCTDTPYVPQRLLTDVP